MIDDEVKITGNGEELDQVSSELSQSGGLNRVWITTERESPVYLTREDIFELGFLRSSPEKKVYQHKDKPSLFLEEIYDKNFGVKEFVVKSIAVYFYIFDGTSNTKVFLYYSSLPDKIELTKIIRDYAE